MLEYVNSGMFIMIAVVASMHVPLFFRRRDTSSYFIIYIFVFTIMSAIYDVENRYTNAMENIQSFKNKEILKCTGTGMYSTSNIFRISVKDDWSIDSNYFVKDSLSIRADKCEEL